MKHICAIVSGFALATALAIAPAAAEKKLNFTADLAGAPGTPPGATSGKGRVTMTYDSATKKLSWNAMVTGLSGDPTGACFHGPAAAGQNAGVMVPASGVKNGVFEGSAILTDAQAKAMMDGQLYFDIHTAPHPNGELRGHVISGPIHSHDLVD